MINKMILLKYQLDKKDCNDENTPDRNYVHYYTRIRVKYLYKNIL
jgi:hypothetical protein